MKRQQQPGGSLDALCNVDLEVHLYCFRQFQHGIKPYLRWRARRLFRSAFMFAPCRALADAVVTALAPAVSHHAPHAGPASQVPIIGPRPVHPLRHLKRADGLAVQESPWIPNPRASMGGDYFTVVLPLSQRQVVAAALCEPLLDRSRLGT